MQVRYTFFIFVLALQLLCLLFYQIRISTLSPIRPPVVPPNKGQGYQFRELEEFLSSGLINHDPKAKRNRFQNNICIIINELEGVTRFGGISASYPF